MAGGAVLLSGLQTVSGVKVIGDVSTGVQAVGLDLSRVQYAALQLNVTASSSPTSLNVYLQHSLDGGVTFDDFISFIQVTTGTSRQIAQWSRDAVSLGGGTFGGETGSASIHVAQDAALTAGSVYNGPTGDYWRIKWVIVGTSYTFSVAVRQITR